MSEKQRQVLENETEKFNKIIIDLQDKLKERSKEVIFTLVFDNISIKNKMYCKSLFKIKMCTCSNLIDYLIF